MILTHLHICMLSEIQQIKPTKKFNFWVNSHFKGLDFWGQIPKCNFSYLDSWLISSQQFQTHWHWDLNFRRFRIFSNIIKAGRRNILDNKTGLNREIMWNDKKCLLQKNSLYGFFWFKDIQYTYSKKKPVL